MEKVRAKFICNSITNYGYNIEAKLSAIHSDNGENADFTKATPNGSLSITIAKDVPAFKFFEVGESYYLDFAKV